MAEGVRDDLNVCRLCGAFENLSLCGGCRLAMYCSREHQKEDWKEHKRTCKRVHGHCNAKQIEKEKSTFIHSSISRSTSATTTESLANQISDGCRPTSTSMPNGDNNQNSEIEVHKKSNEPANRLVTVTNPTNRTLSSDKQDDVDLDIIPSRHFDVSSYLDHKHESDQACVNSTRQESVQMLKSSVPVPVAKNKTGNSKSNQTKKYKTTESGSSLSLSESTSVQERYYLNQKTHKISLPPAHRVDYSSSVSAAPAMGKEDVDSLSPEQTREQYLLILQSRFHEAAKYIIKCLTTYGICVLDHFLGDVTGIDILNEVLQLDSTGLMKQGQLVQSPASSKNKHIRGDMITWVDGTEPSCENIHFLISCMDAVLLKSAKKLKNCRINERTKAMVACYPGGGTGYLRHVDNPNSDGRCITCIYYLNKDWDVTIHGGLLRIYPEGADQVANIEPKFDRLLFFWSDRRNPHEVEQALKQRYAITVWYYDEEERAQALKKFKKVPS